MADEVTTMSAFEPEDAMVLEFTKNRPCPKCNHSIQLCYKSKGQSFILNSGPVYKFEREGFLCSCGKCGFEFAQLIKEEEEN